MPKIVANDIEIAYEIAGNGPPLLLIAGLGYDRWMWHKMVPGLAANFQVITFDNRGVGDSARPPGPYTAQLLAADTAALITALGLGKTAVLGHSMGGFVAQALALDSPDCVSHLILSATNFGGPDHVPITQEALVILMDTTSEPVTRLRRGIEISTAPGFADAHAAFIEEWVAYRLAHPIDPAGYQAQLAIGLELLPAEASFAPKLSRLTMPTLIISGAEDKVVPAANVALLAEKIAYSQQVILPDAGHFYPLEVPTAAVTAVTTFLQQEGHMN